jgi:hypothetical protein
MSFETAVQTLIFEALTDADISAPIYDAVPQSASFPYVTIGDDNSVEWDTCTDYGAAVTVTIHTWSRGRGRLETKTLQGEIYAALHDALLQSTGYNVVSCYFESSVSFMDVDGLTRHGVQTFRVLIEEAS